MKIKTERANVLQRELSDVKRRMTGLTKKAGSRGTSTVNINVKSAVRRLVSAAVQARFAAHAHTEAFEDVLTLSLGKWQFKRSAWSKGSAS